MTQAIHSPNPNHVLSKAFIKAGLQLGLTQAELGQVIGKHRTWVSRLADGTTAIQSDTKGGELALLLIRLARGLFALNNGSEQWTHHFMRSANKLTRGVPAEQITTVTGLITVVEFVDAMRGKV